MGMSMGIEKIKEALMGSIFCGFLVPEIDKLVIILRSLVPGRS